MIDSVIFDLDGTLLDTLYDLTDCVNYTMSFFGYPKRTLAEVRNFVGNGIGRLISQAVPDYVDERQYGIVLESFKEYYTKNCQNKTKAYDGIIGLIERLSLMKIKMAIVSNKNYKAVEELSKKYFDGIIDVAIGDRPGCRRKPSPDSVFEALRRLGSTVKTAVYVGDSEVDIATAKNAGIRNILVTWGFRDKELLISQGGRFFIDKPMELIDYIEGGEW